MQNPAIFPAMKEYPPEQNQQPRLRCPRCESMNTKFCYYNNYNLSQPRHFCKACRRYWTKGGVLRNVPVGGGTRRNSKRHSDTTSSSSGDKNTNNETGVINPHPPKKAAIEIPDSELVYSGIGHLGPQISIGGSGGFSSLLEGNGHYGSLLDSFHHVRVDSENNNESNCLASTPPENLNFWSNGSGSGGGGDDPNGHGAGGEWPDLSIYTPRSDF